MEGVHAAFESSASEVNGVTAPDHGWQKVTYAKRQRKTKPANNSDSNANPNRIATSEIVAGTDNFFRSLEQQSEDRRRRILEAQRAANAGDVDVPPRSKQRSDYNDYEEDEDGDAPENGKVEEVKKVKQKKPKKPKVTVAEAAAKIDAADLAAFLAEISTSYESQQDIQMMRFADYFGRAFSAVGSSQFPWIKLLRESTVSKMADMPLSHISDLVYKTSIDWINQRSLEALSSFVLWSLDSILADLASQQAVAKGSKKAVQHMTAKSQVAMFAVLAMVLRRKPDVLISQLPILRDNSKYQGHDKLPVIVWMISQASIGDLSVGLYAWARNLLPIVSGKSVNPQSRDLVLQLVEKILSAPKARPILINGAVRKGERLIPPSAFEILMRVTFPTSSARVKATERFEAIYSTLKEVALAGSPGSKAMKQNSQQIFSFAIRAAGEGNPELSKEAAGVFIWCLSQSSECYRQWEKIYPDNLEASVSILKQLSEDWTGHAAKISPFEPLRETLRNFRQKNDKALSSGTDAAQLALIEDADKCSKIILGRVSRSHGCMTCLTFTAVALALGAVAFSPSMGTWDLRKLSVALSSQLTF
ncbi:transmembrane protein 214 isoform X2 [Neltuma alba]|uniref:transmembrane protein 214 isoform X2 n=1 Tax=Neltuma alba TaxID=207710 RepID=UPI0010A2E05A|nr:transmembrane protein 214-like isoform X2 [Prosopis alba]